MVRVVVAIWHGNQIEAHDLVSAVAHNCNCPSGSCGAHQAMLNQHWLDYILFLRHIRERLLEEEGLICRLGRWEPTR